MPDAPSVTLVKDFASSDDFTKKHTPYITVETKGDAAVVNVVVGHEVAHPNVTDHCITTIELYAGEAPLARLDLTPEVTNPRFCVPVRVPAGTVVRAVAHCNLHGFWGYEVTL
jgi:superoxide reductase